MYCKCTPCSHTPYLGIGRPLAVARLEEGMGDVKARLQKLAKKPALALLLELGSASVAPEVDHLQLSVKGGEKFLVVVDCVVCAMLPELIRMLEGEWHALRSARYDSLTHAH